MAKSKYEYWLTDEGIILLEGWARDGLTDEQIAQNMGVSRSTLSKWKNDYSDIMDTLKRGKEVVDRMVENALFKKAISGDITAAIFWLKNRKPAEWRDTKNIEAKQEVTTTLKSPFDDLSKQELREMLRDGG